MQINTITITNLFSYYDENVIDLTPTSDDRNIAILSGRNGGGKTSFLNSVKMLFSGLSEEIRRTIQTKRLLTEKQFVFGIGNEWWGITNYQAKQEAGQNCNCSIEITWLSDDGFKVTARRSWSIDYNSKTFEEEIKVNTAYKGVLKEDDAEDFLESCLPGAYIPFFFFDGEEVQRLAESNDNVVIEKMELLLNIKPLENMQDALEQIRIAWQRDAMNKEQERELAEQESRLSNMNLELASVQQQIEGYLETREEQESNLRSIEIKLDRLNSSGISKNQAVLKSKIEGLNSARETHLHNLARLWRRDAFLSLNSAIIKNVLQRLEKLLLEGICNDREILDAIRQKLIPLYSTPPYPKTRLLDSQIKFYTQRIERELSALDVYDLDDQPFQLDSGRARTLLKQLEHYETFTSTHPLQQNLYAAKNANLEIEELRDKAKDTDALSDRQRREYENLMEQKAKISEKLMDTKDAIRDKLYGKSILATNITKEEKLIASSISKVKRAEARRKEYSFTVRLKQALGVVKQRLKDNKRGQLESYYGKYLQRLMDSSTLIEKTTINDNFEIRHLNSDGSEIGMSTLSAGMKQLVATALLWALKSASGRNIPVIIDTPLGRLDRQHQNNLLEHYYPNVSSQVILLPTDSELDEEKYQLLHPYVYRRYLLDNPTGANTNVKLVAN